jgi:aminoglycoside phosphotransferase family enzyme
MGLTDRYGPFPAIPEEILQTIEDNALRWRWRLKPMSSRLSQVHGDFHPFNIIFEKDDRFWGLDRSRGEWGEPADDVSCLSINYLFFSLQRFGRLERPFLDLHDTFWENYLSRAGDESLLEVIQPWFAWRALVLASPVWYADLEADVRMKILGFARCVLSLSRYDYTEVNRYLEAM